MCVLFVVWVKFCFEIYALVSLYSCLVWYFCILYCVLCFVFLFYWCYGSLTPNEDIMRSKCGGGEPCSYFLRKKV